MHKYILSLVGSQGRSINTSTLLGQGWQSAKAIVLLCLMLLSGFNGFSQLASGNNELDQSIQNSTYIFEGTVLKKTPSYGDNKGQGIYTAYIIQIHRIFKGSLQCGTVEMVIAGGERMMLDTVNGKPQMVQKSMRPLRGLPQGMVVGSSVMFFCDPPHGYPSSGESVNNTIRPEVTRIIGYNTGFAPGRKLVEADQTHQYDQIGDFYQLLLSKGQMQMSVCNAKAFKRDEATDFHEYKMKTDPLYKQKVDSIDQKRMEYKEMRMRDTAGFNQKNRNFEELMQYKAASAAKNKGMTKTNYDLTFTLRNFVVSKIGSAKYIDFDLYAMVNNSVYLDNALVKLQFNTSVFGTNPVAGGRVIVNRGTAMALTTNYNDPFYTDHASNTLRIGCGAKFNPAGRYQLLSNTAVDLCHVSMEITGCGLAMDLELTDGAYSTIFCAYTVTSAEPSMNIQSFTTVAASDANHHLSCNPVIDDFYIGANAPNKTGAAGIGEVLTIKGYNFGAVQHKVFLPNATWGGTVSYELDAMDIVPGSWKDNEIKVIIPAIGTTTDLGGNPYVAGSGTIKVETPIVSTQAQATGLILNYAHFSEYDGGNKLRLAHYNQSNGGYTFYMHTDVAANTQMVDCIKAAFNAWRCKTGINIQLATTPTSQKFSGPLNVIYLSDGSNPIPSGMLLAAGSKSTTLCSGFKKVDGFCVVINSSVANWYFKPNANPTTSTDAGKKDFYSLFLHEIGHVGLLDHTNNTSISGGDLMWYLEISYPNRNAVIDDRARDGGKAIVAYETSPALNFGSCGGGAGAMQAIDLSDYAMYDSQWDNLQEPNTQIDIDPAGRWNIWQSPDIWNKVTPSTANDQHVDPEYGGVGVPNYLYTRIKNNGCGEPPAGAYKKLRLYWTIASTGEKWDEDWTTTNIGGQPGGREITHPGAGGPINIPSIPSGTTVTLMKEWFPPRPQNYDASFTKISACVLARIEETPSYPFGMKFSEYFETKSPMLAKALKRNILNNNNIITRNLYVNNLKGLFKRSSGNPVRVGGGVGVPGTANPVVIRIGIQPVEPGTPFPVFTDIGIIDIRLRMPLFNAWQASGSPGYGFTVIDPAMGVIRLNGTEAQLELGTLEDFEDQSDFIEVFYEVFDPWAETVNAQYLSTIRQYSTTSPDQQMEEGETGAVSALINLNVPWDGSEEDPNEYVNPDPSIEPGVEPPGIEPGGITSTTEASKYLVKQGQLRVFPNPAQDKINIQYWEQKGLNKVMIYDELGKMVKQLGYDGFDNQQVIRNIDISDLKHGFYLMMITNEQGTVLNQRFVKH